MSYKQCKLQRTTEMGMPLTSTVTYIPSNLATIGKFIELKTDGVWATWQVASIADAEISEEQAKKLHKRWHIGWNNNI
jgi:hypothetical protein